VLLSRRAAAEAVGTALLVLAVIGSGIAASELSDDTGLQLLANAAATAGALIAIILALGPVSGAHLNPVVTMADRVLGGLTTVEAGVYCGAQVVGGTAGALVANVIFALPAVELSTHARSSGALWASEVVATFGLLVVILGVVRSGRSAVAPFAVAAYIGGAYFFTSSTSFANPAVTLARTLSDTFAGIAPSSVPPFVLAQLIGAGLAIGLVRFLYPSITDVASDVVVPHPVSTGDRTPPDPQTSEQRRDPCPTRNRWQRNSGWC
jgi:arsenate reductase